jgi:hypothetical protein
MANEEVMKEEDGKEEEYVAVETPPEEEDAAGAQAEDDSNDEDERLAESDDDDDDEPQNKRKPLTPEEKRAQRQNRKFRRKAAIENKERELAYLRAENEEFKRRLQAVEKRTTDYDKQAVDQRLSEVLNEIQTVDRIIAKAIEQGAGEDVAKALAIRDQAKERARYLQSVKEQAERPQEPQKPKVDPRVASYAKEWMGENNWYDPKGGDEDSVIVQAIDKRLAQEGFNPATEEYWVELDNRVAKRLPHRYQDDIVETKSKTRKGPPVGGKREYAGPSTRKEVYISPERKQALVDAGVWDDPDLRKKYIKRYAEYDRNNSSR